jgi:hypothetical protein
MVTLKKYRFYIILSLFLILSSILIQVESQSYTQTDILIIYSSGHPYASISDIENPEVDDLTTPTPVKINCATIAKRLNYLLVEKGLNSRIIKVSDINHWKEILEAKAVILGSPTYFWNMSWEMKKLMDEKFGQIYIYRKEKSDFPQFHLFTLAEIEPSANQTLEKMRQVLNDCGLEIGQQMILLTSYKVKDVDWRMVKYIDEIYKRLENVH